MKSYDSFRYEGDYEAHVEREARKGYLLETSVDETTKEAMLAQLLSPEPPDGFYVEIGPAAYPYAIGTSRENIHYVAMTGGVVSIVTEPMMVGVNTASHLLMR